MADIAPHITSANDVIRSLIDQFAADLETTLGGDVLFYKGPIMSPLDEMVRNALEARKTKREKLIFILETNGGFLEVVVRIVDTMRHHYPGEVVFIVPNYAYSAGTVLVLSGNEIYMDYFAVLGPTDPQDTASDGNLIPALGYVERYEMLIKKAQDGTITTAEVTLLISGFDQGRLQMYAHHKELAKTLLKEWLPKYKFKNWTVTETTGKTVTARMRQQRAAKIADILSDTKRWHSHGRGISMDILKKDVHLKIKDFRDEAALKDSIPQFNGLLTDFAARVGANVVLYTPGRLIIPGLGVG